MRQVVCAIALASLAGCYVSGSCDDDIDCSGDLICTDTGECARASSAPGWEITWTVNGAPVSRDAPGDCAAVSELAVRVTASVAGDSLNFRPVPCELGQFDFRALPARFDRLELAALGSGDEVLARTSARREAVNAVDLAF